LYPLALSYACNCLRRSESNSTRIFIDCSIVNYASRQGIQKAGFTPIGMIINASKWTWCWRNRDSSIIRRHAVSVR
jgi:hypothetical protein